MIGFGEAGSILGAELVAHGRDVIAYDILLNTPAMREKARQARVSAADSFSAAVKDADLVISAVTAASSGDVARNASSTLRAGQIFLDINSCSPETKRSNSRLVEGSGADYVESAVMAPVPP